jgi:signal transduction histidine kinase/CheY-like chemotaxis protein
MKRRRSRSRRSPRIDRLLDVIARMAGGELDARAPISRRHDDIDALAFGLNLLGGELHHTLQQLTQARDEAQRANEARSVFLRTVSHELRTPISAILALAELLGRPDLAERERRRLGARIMQNGRSLLRLVDHVLDLSRIEAERIDLAQDALAPDAIVREVVEMLEVETRRRSLPVEVKVASDTPRLIRSDPVRLRQILFNVVGNAIKFTEAGRIDVSVGRLQAPARAGGGEAAEMLAIDVGDTGVGIAAEDQLRLFQPFARARGTARPAEGHGLGLALSRRLAQVLGGDLVLVTSAPGRGSTFRLTVPAPRADVITGAVEAAPVRPPRRDSRALAGLRLLVAEDHDDLRTSLALLLGNVGAEVDAVTDGAAALARATASRFDVILLDVEMPELKGPAVASALRARGDQTPIVAMTAHALQEERDRCLAAGCNDVIVKPFDIDVLIAALDGQATRILAAGPRAARPARPARKAGAARKAASGS